jgi:exodeoxyribonuclease VII small subunit
MSEKAKTRGAGGSGEVDFEKALAELDGIVKRLESGNLALEKSLELFQRGVELARVCKDRLDQAELKVSKLVKEKEGLFREEPFEEEDAGQAKAGDRSLGRPQGGGGFDS